MPINNYFEYMDQPASKGKVATYAEHRADSAAAGAEIDWGVAVQYSAANPNQVVTYDGTGGFVGVALAGLYAEYDVPAGQETDGKHAQYDAVSVFRKGTVWVEVLEDVTKGQGAVVDNTTGNFRPADTATATVSEVVGVFKTTAQADGLAQLEINLP